MTGNERTDEACGAWWNDPEDDSGFMCEREKGHDGDHWQRVTWPQQNAEPDRDPRRDGCIHDPAWACDVCMAARQNAEPRSEWCLTHERLFGDCVEAGRAADCERVPWPVPRQNAEKP